MRKYLIVAATVAILAVAGGSSTAWAGWGCGGHRADGGYNRNWGFATKTQALASMHTECASTRCKIKCARGVDTSAQALVKWPQTIPGQEKQCNSSGTGCK